MRNDPADVRIEGEGVVLRHVQEGARRLYEVFKDWNGDLLVHVRHHNGRLRRVHDGERTASVQLGHQLVEPPVGEIDASVVRH